MRSLTATETTAQESAVLEPKIKITFSDPAAVEADVVVEEDRIKDIPSQEEASDSQTCEVILDNADGYFTTKSLQGWDAVLEWGLVTASGDEYSAIAPLKVLAQNLSSAPGVLQCRLSLVGIPNLLSEQKASKDYSHHWSSTKTAKDMITEIADGEPVTEELTEKQEAYDPSVSYINLDANLHGAGQRLSIPNRTVTKLSFRLKKFGNPAGDITFIIREVEAPQAILLTKVLANANTLTTSGVWYEATFDTPATIDEEITYPAGEDTGGVWAYCEFVDGDAGNYVMVSYSPNAVKPGEWIFRVEAAGAPGDDWETKDEDCLYRYKYTGAGIDCFEDSHDAGLDYEVVYDPHGTHTGGVHATIMTDSAAAFKTDALIGQVIRNGTDGSSGTITDNDATTVTVAALAGGGDNQWDTNDVYTIEDALLDVYTPKDAFIIREGQSRLDKINQLLGYTGGEKIVRADGKIHVFVPITSGTEYDSENSLTSGHTFFSKAVRKALVIPNRIVVKSLKTDATEYSGEATSATSFGLLPITSAPIRTSLVDNAQGASIAAAMISRLEIAAQRGAASVPMNLGSEVFDYVKVNALNTEDTSRTGNIGYIRRSYRPGTTWRMDFGFGGVALKGVPGTGPSLLQREPIPEPTKKEATLKWEPSFEIIDDQLDWLYGRGEYENELTGMKWVEAAIAELWGDKGLNGLVSLYNAMITRLGWVEGQEPTDEQIDAALLPYYTKTQIDAQIEHFNWLAESTRILTDSNRTSTLAWTDLDVTAQTSASTFAVALLLQINVDSEEPGQADSFQLEVRKNGDTPTYYPRLRVGEWLSDSEAPRRFYAFVIVGVDADEKLEYQLSVGDFSGNAQADFYIDILGYWDKE